VANLFYQRLKSRLTAQIVEHWIALLRNWPGGRFTLSGCDDRLRPNELKNKQTGGDDREHGGDPNDLAPGFSRD